MSQDWKQQIDLPDRITQGIERFCEDAKEALGDQLDALILYGGIAKGEYRERTSDVNILIALSSTSLDALDALTKPIQRGRREIKLSSLILSENDLERSTDVFPIKFLDIQKHHVVLHGKDVLEKLEIHQDHLRLRCEQELKNLMLRMRSFYIQRIHRAELIEQTLNHVLSAFLIAADALLYLKDGQHHIKKSAIIEALGNTLDLDRSLLTKLLQLKRGESEAELEELKTLYAGFMSLIEQAADIADRLEDEETS